MPCALLKLDLGFIVNLVKEQTVASSNMVCSKQLTSASAVTGRGSYGSVYKAQVKGTQEVVAVKVIPLGDKDEVLEIQKEIEMLKECNHPNVVRYLVSAKLFGNNQQDPNRVAKGDLFAWHMPRLDMWAAFIGNCVLTVQTSLACP